jgi:hypothetical protein
MDVGKEDITRLKKLGFIYYPEQIQIPKISKKK